MELYNKCEYWDGNTLPNLVKNVLKNSDLFFGGSSLLHDRYFPNEIWENRDYDIWGKENDIEEAVENIKNNYKNINIEFVQFNNNVIDYSNISYIINIKIDDLHIQFLELAPGKTIKNIIDNCDLSFLKMYYHNDYIYYFTDEDEILQRKGSVNVDLNMILQNSKLDNRITKYKTRWFSFTNLCVCCHRYINPSINHYENCIKNHVDNSHIDEVLQFSLKNPDNKLFIAILTIFIKTSMPEDFIRLYNYYRSENIKVNIHEDEDHLFRTACYNGMTTICKFLYMLSLNEDKPISICGTQHNIFKNVINKNLINTAKFLCKIFPYYSIKCIDDKVIKWNVESLFDIYAKSRDREQIAQILGGRCSLTQECLNCPICKTESVEIKLGCGHSFCTTCLTLWLNQEDTCPYCKNEVN